MTEVTNSANRTVPRAELRRRLYDAALALFRDKGFEATTVEEIARAAFVAKGTVFNFFPTKGAILLAYYEQLDARFDEGLRALSPEDPKASLIRFYGEAERMLRAEGPLAEAVFRQVAADADLANADTDSGDKDRDALTAFFRACRDKGTIGADPVVAAHVAADLWSATVQDWLRNAKRYGLKLRLAVKLDAVFKGLAALLLMLLCGVPHARAEAPPEGLYEDAHGVVAITPFAEFGAGEFFIDYASGLTSPMSADGAIGDGMVDPKTSAGKVVRASDGLRVEIGATPRSLRTIPLSHAPFRVKNGDAVLAGEIVRRTDVASRGAVVIVHGSNDSPRGVYGPWVDFLVARGWSVAVYDKRGSGESSGSWRNGGFPELASDVRAIGDYARQPHKPLGLLGISQAGWVMPLAARQGGFDFIVSLAGAGVTPERQTLDFVRGQLEAYGLPPSEIADAMAYYRLDMDVTLGVKPWSAIDAAYRQAVASKAEWILSPPEPANSGDRAFLRRIARFDVLPTWRKLDIPVLILLGGRDNVVAVDPNRALLADALAHNKNARIVVLPDDNHVGMLARTGTLAEYKMLDRFDPVYFRTLADWLDATRR